MPPGFREQALGRTIAAVRQQRRRRQAVNLAVPLAAVALAIVLSNEKIQPSATPPALPALNFVTSQPLTPEQIIRTEPGSVVLLSSVPGSMGWITDQPESSLVKVLDDDALLKLLAGRGAALVQVSPDQTTLVFANPADMKGFRLP